MTPAYTYIRVSSRGQCADDKDGLDRQLRAIDDYAAKSGFQIVRRFSEDGVTGTTEYDARPAMSDMLEAIRTGDVRHVIVENADRLARDYVVQELIVRKFQNYKTTIVSAQGDDLCDENPTRVFVRRILGAVADLDRCLIVNKTRTAREKKRALTGRCEGRKPYGERPGEHDVILRIKAKSESGVSALAIANHLNAWEVTTRYGKPWTATQVQRILSRAQSEVTQ